MVAFTVQLPGGGVETFADLDGALTVKGFKATVKAKTGIASFNLYFRGRDGDVLLKKEVDDEVLLGFLDVSEDAKFVLKKQGQGWSKEKQAQVKLDRGITKCATSLKFTKVKPLKPSVGGVATAVSSMQADVTAILNAVVAPPLDPVARAERKRLRELMRRKAIEWVPPTSVADRALQRQLAWKARCDGMDA